MSNREVRRTTAIPLSTRAAGVLQRKCDCGNHTIGGGECDECGKKQMSLQRATQNSELRTRVSGGLSPRAHDVPRSPERILGAQTRSFFEPRFGHDFSRIPVRDFSAARRTNNEPAMLFDGAEPLELGHTDCDWKRDVAEDEVFKPNSEKPKLNISNTDPCTSACTVAHEKVHITQLQPICKDYYACFKAAAEAAKKSAECKEFKGAEHTKCVGLVAKLAQFDCFEKKVADLWDPMKWECEAYKKSLKCAQDLQKTVKKDCSGKLGSYIYNATKSIDMYCKKEKTTDEPPKQPDKPDKPVKPAPKVPPTPPPKK